MFLPITEGRRERTKVDLLQVEGGVSLMLSENKAVLTCTEMGGNRGSSSLLPEKRMKIYKQSA